MGDLISWFNVDRIAVLVAAIALVGILFAARSARAAKKQADHAQRQVELGHQQVDLLMRQIRNAEEAEAANQKARRESLEPMVVVDIAPGVNDPGNFVLTISNVGPSIARKVKITPSGEMTRADGTKMHEWSVFTEGIETMPPGHMLQFFYDVGFQPFKGNSPLRCTFTVDCEGPFGSVPQATYVVDLTPYKGAWASPTSLSSVVKQLEKIAKNVEQAGKVAENALAAEHKTLESSVTETTQLDDDWRTWTQAD